MFPVPLFRCFCRYLHQAKQIYHNPIAMPQMQEASDLSLNFTVIGLILSLVIVIYAIYSKRRFKRRISNLRNRTPEEIPSDKIIIAIQPNQLFFKLATTAKSGWREVILRDESESGFWGGVIKLFRKKIYYRLNHQKTEIVNFVQGLAQNNRIQLYLYTTVSLQIAEFIFKQLGILKYFPEQFRISKQGSQNNKMHAIQVDSQTNRVIIFTGSKADYEEEYAKYFLVMRKKDKLLCKVGKKVGRLVTLNENVDQLHNQLNALKIKVQSQSEDCNEGY